MLISEALSWNLLRKQLCIWKSSTILWSFFVFEERVVGAKCAICRASVCLSLQITLIGALNWGAEPGHRVERGQTPSSYVV
jgi:hypothetical protein